MQYTILGSTTCGPCKTIKSNLKEGIKYVDQNSPDFEEFLNKSKLRIVPQLFADDILVTTDIKQIKELVCK